MSNIKTVVTFQNRADCEALSEFASATSAAMSLGESKTVCQDGTNTYRIITSPPDYDSANNFLNTLWRQAKLQNIEFVKCDLVDLDAFDQGLYPELTT